MVPQRTHKNNILDNNIYEQTYQDRLIEKLRTSLHDCVIHHHRLHFCGGNASIPIRAKHIDDFIQSSCLPLQYNISYAVGNLHTHHSRSIVLYGGVYLCRRCVSTASNKFVNLGKPYTRPTVHRSLSIKAYQKGTKLRGFTRWLYKSVYMMENATVNNIQQKIDQMQKAYAHQYLYPESISYPESDQENIVELDHADCTDDASESGSD